MRLCCLSPCRPGVVSSCQLVVASHLVVSSLRRPLVVLSTSSHCAALSSSCRASWLSHCLSLSSHCANLSSSRRVSLLLLRRLSLSSHCAPRRPLVLSPHRLVVALPLDALPSCHLIVSSCRLSLFLRASWLLRHHLLSSSRCTALSSSHLAGWLLRCLSLCRPLVLSSIAHAIERRRMLPPPSNTTATTAIECHLYHLPLPQLPSIATIKCQCPPLFITVVKR